MLDKLAGIEARYEELNRLMAEGTGGDYAKITEYAKERAELEEIVTAFRTHRTVLSDLEGARALQAHWGSGSDAKASQAPFMYS